MAPMTGQLAVPRILWAALLGSTLIYVAVLELAAEIGEPRWEFLLLPLSVAGLAAAGASLLGPRIMLRRRRSGRGSEEAADDASGGYLVALIIALALAESVAIFGLVLGLQGAPPRIVMPFFAVAWVLMLIRFPTQEKLDEFRA